MSNYNNSICRICGKGYHRCHCSSEGNWRKVTDTSEHYQIFCVIRDYLNGVITACRAYSLLSKLDLSEKDSFVDDKKAVIDEIFNKKKTTDKKMDERAKKIDNTVTVKQGTK